MSIDIEERRHLIEAVKAQIPTEVIGDRNEDAVRGTLLTALVMARAAGFTKDEALALAKEEWLHLTSIDNKTVKGGKR